MKFIKIWKDIIYAEEKGIIFEIHLKPFCMKTSCKQENNKISRDKSNMGSRQNSEQNKNNTRKANKEGNKERNKLYSSGFCYFLSWNFLF